MVTLKNAGPVMNEIVGGWQISVIERYRSGLPSSIFYGGVFPTNFSFGAVAYPIASYTYGTSTYDQAGTPAYSSFDHLGQQLAADVCREHRTPSGDSPCRTDEYRYRRR